MIDSMDDDALERAHEAALLAATLLGVEVRERQARRKRIMDAVFKGAPCSDPVPPFETHCCAPLDDDGMHDDPPSRPIP